METHGIKHSRSQALIDFAFRFAKEVHGDQVRKYTAQPYITHPVAVANIIAAHTDDCEMICAALLHDVVEDTHATVEDIDNVGFGFTIAKLVDELTDISKPEDGNRKHRKTLDCHHLAGASGRAQTVKLADLIHNTQSIVKHDPKFAVMYLQEKYELLKVLTKADPEMQAKGWRSYAEALMKLRS